MSAPRILIVDHNPPILEVVGGFLRAEGYSITEAGSSTEALKLGGALKPHLVIIDPIMPGISGVEAATRLSRDTKCKVLFLTALADDSDFREMVRGLHLQGIDASVLARPFDRDHLLASVRKSAGSVPIPAEPGNSQASGTEKQQRPSTALQEVQPHPGLLSIATINLYQENAFRITGLPVGASLREVSKGAEKIEMTLRLGRSLSPVAVFPLAEQPTIESVRNALQLLKDPESRLVQELFWFWPCSSVSSEDQAIAALNQKQYQAAADIWTKTKGPGNGIAIHNLAVFHHLGALESALRRIKSSQTTPAEEIFLWSSAYRYWKALLDRSDFWEAVASRIRTLDDPRLKPGAAHQMWRALPNAIVRINAQIAVKAAEAGNFEEAAKHRKIMFSSAFGEVTAREETRLALASAGEELERICRNAEQQARANPKAANLVVRKLFEEKSKLLSAFNFLLGIGDPICDATHDRVAEAGRFCVVDYVNETEDWEFARLTLEECLALAEGKALRLKLEDDLEVVGRNLSGQQQSRRTSQPAQAQSSAKATPAQQTTAYKTGKALGRNKLVAVIFVGVVILFAAVKGCDDSSNSSTSSTPHPVTATTPQPTQAYDNYSQSSQSVPYGGTQTRTQLKAEIDADSRTLDSLEADVKTAHSSVAEYDSLLGMDKAALDRMKRNNDAGIEVDETLYETTRRRYNANVGLYIQALTEYKAKAARYNQLLAATNAKIDRYNSQGRN
jgi:CheY-like chemotaxis protein